MSKRYLVVYYQNGGCDYTIGCGTRVVHLPEDCDSLEKAKEWLKSDKDEAVPYFGNRIDSMVLYEIGDSIELNPQNFL